MPKLHQVLLLTLGWSHKTPDKEFMQTTLNLVSTWCLLPLMHIQSGQRYILFVSYTTIQQTIDKLRTNFATHGLPTTLVYDNSPPFTSVYVEFEKFMKANGITHRCIPPYHPSSNDLVKIWYNCEASIK